MKITNESGYLYAGSFNKIHHSEDTKKGISKMKKEIKPVIETCEIPKYNNTQRDNKTIYEGRKNLRKGTHLDSLA